MKKLSIALLIVITSFSFNSCELLDDINLEDGLSTEDIVSGLKKALEIGTDSASNVLSIENGYYGNALLRIPLPEEAVKIQNELNAILNLAPSLSGYLNLDDQFEKVIKSVNRAAEKAAQEAAPIFKSAITDLSISQGLEILNGEVPDTNQLKSTNFDSTAATVYLKMKTYSGLTNLYAPKIDNALDQDLGLGFSANDAWSTLRTSYNSAVSTVTGNFALNLVLNATGYSLNKLETESIGVFATEKALDGLFVKVGDEEKKIRKDPFAWAEDIIQRVFGSLSE